MKLQSLKAKIKSGEIDTVIVGFPDVFGRLVGKRFTGQFFLENVLGHGTHGCSYLLTVDIEMEPMSGFKLANWEKGFGDFELRPDLKTLRPLPWQPGTALVICDLYHPRGLFSLSPPRGEGRGEGSQHSQLVAESPRAVLQRQVELLARRK